MKRVISLLLVTLIAFLFYRYQNNSHPSLNQVSQEKIKKNNIFLANRKINHSRVTKKDESNHPEQCLELISSLEKIDFNLEMDEWMSQFDFSTLENCQDKTLKKSLSEIQTKCLKNKNTESCPALLVILRARMRTQGVQDAEDRDTLVDLILAEFYRTEPDFKKMNVFAEKMLAIEPNNPVFEKIWMTSKLIGGLQDQLNFNHYSEEIMGRVNPSVWDDPQMEMLKIALETNFDPTLVEQIALGKNNDELLGWSLWKQGKTAEALNALDRAIAKNPKDQFLIDQRERLRKNPKDAQGYQGRFSLGFNTRDIFN